MATTDQRIHRVARLGVVTRARLLDAGLSDAEIQGRLRRGSLRRIHAGVYATFGAGLGPDARLLAACLAAGPGAVASHRAGLWVWKLLDGVPPIEISAPRSTHSRADGVIVHRPDVLRPQDCTTRAHVPVTTPMRALLDAGAVVPAGVLGDCVERALVNRLVTVKGLRTIVQDLGGQGRAGTAALRSHLDRRSLGDRRPESMIEPLMARLLASDLGIGPVDYQPTLVLAGRRVRPDFVVRLAHVAVEVDGLEVHRSRRALDADLERQNLLIRHGYLVLRYTVTHLRAPAKVVAQIRAVSLRRMEDLGVRVA